MLPVRNPLKNGLRVKSCNKMHMLTLIQRKPLSILISDKADFRGKNINEKGKNFILIMESTIQENIAILSVYAPNYKI